MLVAWCPHCTISNWQRPRWMTFHYRESIWCWHYLISIIAQLEAKMEQLQESLATAGARNHQGADSADEGETVRHRLLASALRVPATSKWVKIWLHVLRGNQILILTGYESYIYAFRYTWSGSAHSTSGDPCQIFCLSPTTCLPLI